MNGITSASLVALHKYILLQLTFKISLEPVQGKHIINIRLGFLLLEARWRISRALKFKVYESGAIENFLRVNAEAKNEVTLFPKNRPPYED
jgi:hypothetical protein